MDEIVKKYLMILFTFLNSEHVLNFKITVLLTKKWESFFVASASVFLASVPEYYFQYALIQKM